MIRVWATKPEKPVPRAEKPEWLERRGGAPAAEAKAQDKVSQ